MKDYLSFQLTNSLDKIVSLIIVLVTREILRATKTGGTTKKMIMRVSKGSESLSVMSSTLPAICTFQFILMPTIWYQPCVPQVITAVGHMLITLLHTWLCIIVLTLN